MEFSDRLAFPRPCCRGKGTSVHPTAVVRFFSRLGRVTQSGLEDWLLHLWWLWRCKGLTDVTGLGEGLSKLSALTTLNLNLGGSAAYYLQGGMAGKGGRGQGRCCCGWEGSIHCRWLVLPRTLRMSVRVLRSKCGLDSSLKVFRSWNRTDKVALQNVFKALEYKSIQELGVGRTSNSAGISEYFPAFGSFLECFS